MVCDKTFKSEAQFKAHEKSKKHVKLLKQLQMEMRAEGAELDLDADNIAPGNEVVSANGDGHDDEPEQPQFQDHNTPKEESDDAEPLPEKNGTLDAEANKDASEDSEEENDDYAPRSQVEKRLAGGPLESASAALEDLSLSGTPVTSDPEQPGQPKLGKAKQKKAKKAAQKAAAQSEKATSEFQCVVCKADFPSKNRLFDHIKEEDHAALQTQTKGGKGKGRKR